MKFKMGDKVCFTLFNKVLEGKIIWTYPETHEYQVSVGNGAGGFHIVKESELTQKEV